MFAGTGEMGTVRALTFIVAYEVGQAALAKLMRERPSIADEISVTLSRRAKLISSSIALCTTTALLVCAVIATGFLSAVLLRFDASVTVAILFIAAMVTFFVGLVLFLREIFVATANLRIGPR